MMSRMKAAQAMQSGRLSSVQGGVSQHWPRTTSAWLVEQVLCSLGTLCKLCGRIVRLLPGRCKRSCHSTGNQI